MRVNGTGLCTNFSAYLKAPDTKAKEPAKTDETDYGKAQTGAVTVTMESEEKVPSRRLTSEEEMFQFQQEFYAEVAKIPMSGGINSLAVRITDEGWKRMKEQPEYREKMLSLIKRDTTGTYPCKVNEIITIGRSPGEYRASSYGVERKVDKKDRSARRRKKKKEMLQELYARMQMQHALEKDLLAKLGEGEFTVSNTPASPATMMLFTPAVTGAAG